MENTTNYIPESPDKRSVKCHSVFLLFQSSFKYNKWKSNTHM